MVRRRRQTVSLDGVLIASDGVIAEQEDDGVFHRVEILLHGADIPAAAEAGLWAAYEEDRPLLLQVPPGHGVHLVTIARWITEPALAHPRTLTLRVQDPADLQRIVAAARAR